MICPCGKLATQKHHRFHQSAWAKKLYGQMIHDDRNLQDACAACNVSHAGSALEHWTEEQFCQALGIEPRSKQAKFRKATK